MEGASMQFYTASFGSRETGDFWVHMHCRLTLIAAPGEGKFLAASPGSGYKQPAS